MGERNGFTLVEEKGSIRHYGKAGLGRLFRIDDHGGMRCQQGPATLSLVIEARDDPICFGFYSPDLKDFTGVGHSIEDCLYKARWGMREHVDVWNTRSCPSHLRIRTQSSRFRNQPAAAR